MTHILADNRAAPDVPHESLPLNVHKITSIYNNILFVGSCLVTKAFIGNLPVMGRGWVVIKYIGQ